MMVRIRPTRLLRALASAPRTAQMSYESSHTRYVPVIRSRIPNVFPLDLPEPMGDVVDVGEWAPRSLRSYEISKTRFGWNCYRRGLAMLESPIAWRLTRRQAERAGAAWVAGGEW
jgi:hypothetical protein